MTLSAPISPEVDRNRTAKTKPGATTRTVVAAFGALVALAGIEHGVGELLQGWRAPSSVVIQSWPDTAGFEVVSGEPAMTLIPNLFVAGMVTIFVAVVLGVWAVRFIDRPGGGLVLIGLSLLLLLVGGGFGTPLIGVIVGLAATRISRGVEGKPGLVGPALARFWPWLLGAGLLGYVSLVPGMVLVSRFTGFDAPWVVSLLTVSSFAGLILALVAARARDRLGERG